MEGQQHENDQLQTTAAEPTPLEAAIPDNSPAAAFNIDPLYQEKVQRYMDGLHKEENLLLGLLLGLAAAIVGGVLWAVIAVSTGYTIGYVALAVGFMVGFAVRFGGKGMSQIFGIGGAILALLGCVLGNFFSVIGFIASEGNVGVFEVLGFIDVSAAFALLQETAQPMDLLFYGIAIYQGYRFSFRNLTDEELAAAGNA